MHQAATPPTRSVRTRQEGASPAYSDRWRAVEATPTKPVSAAVGGHGLPMPATGQATTSDVMSDTTAHVEHRLCALSGAILSVDQALSRAAEHPEVDLTEEIASL